MGTNIKPQKKSEKSIFSRKNKSDIDKSERDKMKIYGDIPDTRPRTRILVSPPKNSPSTKKSKVRKA